MRKKEYAERCLPLKHPGSRLRVHRCQVETVKTPCYSRDPSYPSVLQHYWLWGDEGQTPPPSSSWAYSAYLSCCLGDYFHHIASHLVVTGLQTAINVTSEHYDHDDRSLGFWTYQVKQDMHARTHVRTYVYTDVYMHA